jgi:parvulin-like peptidyl-prolyl isomerase
VSAPGRIIACASLVAVGLAAVGCGSSAPHEGARAKPVISTTAPDRASKKVPDSARKPVAKIGGTTITLGVLQHWVSISNHRQTEVPEPPDYTACIEHLRATATSTTPQTTERLRGACRLKYDELLKPALSSLIRARWLIGEAADEGLKVDRAKLKRESALSGPHGEEVRQAIASTDKTISDVEFKLMVSQVSDQIYRKLERNVPTVTRAQVSEYYKRHKKSFVVPERRDLHIVRTASDAAARSAKQEIEGGTSFATVVKKTSLTQPDTAHDGLLLGLAPNNWPEQPLSSEVFHARLKTLGGPVKISLGYYVFEVVRRVPARQSTLAEVKPEIATQLHRLLRDRMLSRFVAAFRRKWTSRTNCLHGYVVKYCRQYRSSRANSQESPHIL